MTEVYDPEIHATAAGSRGQGMRLFWSVNKLLVDMDAAGLISLVASDAEPGSTSVIWLDISSPEYSPGVPKAYSGGSWVTLTKQLFYSHIAGGATGYVTDAELAAYVSNQIGVSLQAWDADLDALAALTTTAYGRSLLELADAAAGRTALGLGTLATQSGTFSGTSSGTNTGDQTITLTGNVTGSGTGSFAATIANNAVTNAKAADMPTATFKGRASAGTGDPEDLTVAQAKTLLNLTGTNSGDQTITLTGDVTGTGTGTFAATIANDAVTYAKMQNVSAASKLLGRGDSGSGDVQEITLGTGLSMSGTTLSSSGGSGVSDGDKGDITVSGSGAVWTIDNAAVTYAKIQDVSANSVLARAAATNGTVSGVTLAASQLLGRGSSGDVAAIGLGPNLSVSGTTLDATPLGLWDYWAEHWIGHGTAAISPTFLGVAISSGTTSATQSGSLGYNQYGALIRSSTTNNSGYRYGASSTSGTWFGTGTAYKFQARYMPVVSMTSRLLRIGWHDTGSATDAVDGVYFELSSSTCSAKTSNNSTRTTNATTVTISIDVAYVFDIEVNADGTEARFRVYAGTSSTPILDVTNTANIPTSSARACGPNFVATMAGTTASDIGVIYTLGVGTLAGFNKLRGAI